MEEPSDGPWLPSIRFLPSSLRRFKFSQFLSFPGVTNPIKLDFSDALALVLLTAVGIFSHVFRIQFPRNSFPDEPVTLGHINAYLNGTWFFPRWPPFASQLQATVAYFLSYDALMKARPGGSTQCTTSHCG
jgi:dolichyl-phosphate-mannose--protein O-mannosyl transferase